MPKVTDFKDQPQGHTGAHQCGQPSWYVDGLPTDPPGVPVVYNADGLPVCCAPGRGLLWGRPQLPGRGGLLWGSFTPEIRYRSEILEPFGDVFMEQLNATTWGFSPGFGLFQLEAPDPIFHPLTWQLKEFISLFLNGLWETDASWDGTGFRTFDFVSGAGFSGTRWVERA